jgi:hypothetical protein
MNRILLTLLLCLMPLSASAFAAQSGNQLVEGRVLAVIGDSFEIDRGLLDGLRQGDSITIYVPSGNPITARLTSVAQRSATIIASGSSGKIDVGVRVEIRVPTGRNTSDQGDRQGQAVEHPPWENAIDNWPSDKPLLAPATGLTAADRPVSISGRMYAFSDMIWDDERSTSSVFSRAGLDMRIGNALGFGGQFRFDVEGNQFDFSTDDGLGDDSGSDFRLDRLSYAIGGDRYRPVRVEAGRFLQREFPQFGVLDGAEVSLRLGNGHRLGSSIGYIPLLYGNNAGTGEDLQTAFYYRAVSNDEKSNLGAGYQKSWHNGDADRDLIVVEGSTRLDGGFFFHSSAWIDLYDANDLARDGTELTRVVASGSYRSKDGNGWMASLSQFRFPDLQQQQVFDPTALVYTDKEVRRGDVTVFRKFTKSSTGTARAHFWNDEDNSGGGGELRWDVRDLWIDRSRLGAAVFLSKGQFSDVLGLRLNSGLNTGFGHLRLSWNTSSYANVEFSNGNSDLLQHRARLSLDTNLSADWSLSLYGELRAGDEQDSRSAGFYLQKSL